MTSARWMLAPGPWPLRVASTVDHHQFVRLFGQSGFDFMQVIPTQTQFSILQAVPKYCRVGAAAMRGESPAPLARLARPRTRRNRPDHPEARPCSDEDQPPQIAPHTRCQSAPCQSDHHLHIEP